MILNVEKCIQVIADYLSDYIKKSNRKNFIIEYNNHVLDYVTVKLCEVARQKCGAEIYTYSAFEPPKFDFAKPLIYDPMEEVAIALDRQFIMNCDKHKAIIVSGMCRTSGIVERAFHKHLSFADIYPVLDLYYSEILQLYEYFGRNEDVHEQHAFHLYKNHEMLEYCDRENSKNKIIESDTSPDKNPTWFKYTSDQKKAIAKLHQKEKLTRHKDLLSRGALFPSLRNDGLLR